MTCGRRWQKVATCDQGAATGRRKCYNRLWRSYNPRRCSLPTPMAVLGSERRSSSSSMHPFPPPSCGASCRGRALQSSLLPLQKPGHERKQAMLRRLRLLRATTGDAGCYNGRHHLLQPVTLVARSAATPAAECCNRRRHLLLPAAAFATTSYSGFYKWGDSGCCVLQSAIPGDGDDAAYPQTEMLRAVDGGAWPR